MTPFKMLLFSMLISAPVAHAQVQSKLLSTADLAASQKQISPKMIPGFLELLHTQPKQAFAVSVGGGPQVWVLPVTYVAKFDEGEKQHCGLFVFEQGKSPSFSETFGPAQDNPSECEGLKAIGFMASMPDQPPRLILQIGASLLVSMGNTERTIDMLVFDWNPASNHYSLNKSLSDRLEKDKRPTSTIAQTKRLIETYERQKLK